MAKEDGGGKLKMGTRNLFANKQRQEQPPKSYHQLGNGNLMFGDDGGGPVEQAHIGGVGGGHSYGSGADEASRSNLHHHHHHQRKVNSNRHHQSHQIQYVNSDGSIYLNQSNDALKSSQNIRPNSFISAGNLEQRPAFYHHAQQNYHHHRGHNQRESQQPEALASSIDDKQQHHHRLLQHQVHQQLQQIYENAERKPAQTIYELRQNKHDHSYQANDRQQLILKRHAKQQMNQDQHVSMPVVGYNLQPTEFIEREQQFRSAMMMKSQQNSLMMAALDGQGNGLGGNQQPRSLQQYSQHHEQQYDSLGPPGTLKQHQQLNEQQNFYVVGTETSGPTGQQRQQLHQVPICSIPEECSSSSSSGSSNSNSKNNSNNNNNININNNSINENELLIPEVSLTQSSNRAIIDRRSQLEDLHYATVTAAALLSATANAAAAFAATEKQYDRSREGQGMGPAADDVAGGSCSGDSHSHLNQLNSIYSDAHQDVRRQHIRSQQVVESQHQHNKQQRQHPIQASRLLKKRLPLQQQQHLGRAPAYAITTDPLINFVNFAEQRAQPAGAIATALYGPAIVRANQNQPAQIYHIQQVASAANYQQQHQQNQRNINFPHHPQPPQPPIRRQQLPQLLSNDPMRHQRIIHAVHQRPPSTHKQLQHHQQQVPLTLPQAQALALLNHRGGKGCVSLRADLIGRLLVNNLMASQRPLTSDNHYHQGGQPSSRALANKLLDGHGLLGRELIYGMAGREKLFGLSRANFHVQSAAAAAVAVAPSDSSGHSQVPLVLDRKLKPRGFIERICRIDLTIFWWSLLIISFLFIGALYTLSRYIL